MNTMPDQILLTMGEKTIRMVHGSPLAVNQLLWESTPDEALEVRLEASGTDVLLSAVCSAVEPHYHRHTSAGGGGLLGKKHASPGGRVNTVQTAVCTYTGLHWEREIDGRKLVNVGVIGHPANDGRTEVWYALLRQSSGEVEAEFIPVAYDHEALARQMREEGLPEPFVETILTG
jgi:hypothetical protein